MNDAATQNADLVERVLAAAVEIGVGTPDARPRPGQLALARDMADAQTIIGDGPSGRGHVSGNAGVGIGKSYAGLSNAAVRAVKHGERTLYATKSLPLQSQIVEKDAPVVSAAAKRELGEGFTFALLKGWANFVCGNRAYELAAALLGQEFVDPSPSGIKPLLDKLRRLPNYGAVNVDGADVDLAQMKPLAIWALEQVRNPNATGDKDTYDGELNEAAWKSVAVTPDECIGLDVCPFAEFCKSDRSRTKAAEAQVVVTNHALLAVQASMGVPVVLGNATLGHFDHIIIDEAHELPKTVRSQGECSVSGRRMSGLIRLMKNAAGDRDDKIIQWVEQGHMIADLAEQEIHAIFNATSNGEVGRLGENDDPLANTGDGIIAWARIGSRLLKKPMKVAQRNGKMGKVMAGKRAQAGIDSLVADVNSVRTHRKGQARWLQPPDKFLATVGRRRPPKPWYAAQAAPVEVGGLMRANLWTQTIEDEETGDELDVSPSVVAMSGTLPPGFIIDAGLTARETVVYELPFKEAYTESMLYIPSAKSAEDVEALTLPGYGKKRKFTVAKHALWALDQMYELIDANGGHALVLSATTREGKAYTDALRKHAAGRWEVYSQWDGGAERMTLAKWKADPTAVLVGTQGLMTGVDAPGETCSLVILDRVPRAGGNAKDDARVDLIAERMGGDTAASWTGKRLVYVADAVEKMGQARGRLVRGGNDRGMFAVLDPRMLKNHEFTYEERARKDMMEAVDVYGIKTTDQPTALAFLRARQAGLGRAA